MPQDQGRDQKRTTTKTRKGTYLGTTGSSCPFAASIASFHLAVHRHHLQPGSRPIDLRLLPRDALKSRNSFVRTPVSCRISCSAWHEPGQRRRDWDTYRQRRGFRHLRARHDSSRHDRSRSWAFGRRGPGAFSRLMERRAETVSGDGGCEI